MKADLIDKYFHSKNILITGGAGFVGSHLAERISMPSNNVVSLDNYLSGRYSNHVENVSYIEGDVNNILEVFGTQKFDFIFHFGEYSRVEKSLEEPYVALSNTHKPSLHYFNFGHLLVLNWYIPVLAQSLPMAV